MSPSVFGGKVKIWRSPCGVCGDLQGCMCVVCVPSCAWGQREDAEKPFGVWVCVWGSPSVHGEVGRMWRTPGGRGEAGCPLQGDHVKKAHCGEGAVLCRGRV